MMEAAGAPPPEKRTESEETESEEAEGEETKGEETESPPPGRPRVASGGVARLLCHYFQLSRLGRALLCRYSVTTLSQQAGVRTQRAALRERRAARERRVGGCDARRVKVAEVQRARVRRARGRGGRGVGGRRRVEVA